MNPKIVLSIDVCSDGALHVHDLENDTSRSIQEISITHGQQGETIIRFVETVKQTQVAGAEPSAFALRESVQVSTRVLAPAQLMEKFGVPGNMRPAGMPMPACDPKAAEEMEKTITEGMSLGFVPDAGQGPQG